MAPLAEHDAILGMPFLAEEGILVDPAQNKVILPTVKAPSVHTEKEGLGLDGNLKDEVSLDDDVEQELDEADITEELAVELVDGKNGIGKDEVCAADEVGKVGMEWMEAEFLSICPKVKTVHNLVPPQPNLT